MKIQRTILTIPACLALAVSQAAIATPIDVQYTVSGSSNNWALNFSVTNNIPFSGSGMDVYFFGVRLPARDIGGSPTGWDPNAWTVWDNTPWGGTAVAVFNNNWLGAFANSPTDIEFGETLSGFIANVAIPTAPTSVDWFVYGLGRGIEDTYTGSFDDTVYDSLWNPGFEGTALQANGVPEPSSLALLGLGFASLVLSRRRNRS